jgi:soluble lytic murein transglycosylase-like protein
LLEFLISIFICLNSYTMDLNQEGVILACKKSHKLITKSDQLNIDPFLAYSVIYHESRWKSDALSSVGACGLTQVIPKWTGEMTGDRRYSCSELLEPSNSIRAGLHALDYWFGRSNGDVERGLCAYNAGNRCLRADHSGSSVYARMVLRTSKDLRSKWNASIGSWTMFLREGEDEG